MTERLCFGADHPVTVRWSNVSGSEVERWGRLRRVTDSALSIMLRQMVSAEDALKIGTSISAEAGVDRSGCVALFRGAVVSIESRLITIKVNGGIEVRERRKYRRAQPKFRFATAVALDSETGRHFLVHPVDLGAGGIRIRHHVDLKPGDRIQIVLKLKSTLTLSPTAEVIESWPENTTSAAGKSARPTYISRAAFVGLQPNEQKLIGSYVAWLLKPQA